MNTELQNKAWSVLPKEFKEEVKKDYQYAVKNRNRSVLQRGASDTLEHFFGIHNLTSDAEGEEMLYVSRKEVIRNYKEKVAWKGHHQSSKHDRDMATGWYNALRFLFGSKCLPDETVTDCHGLQEPKPSEPKYHVGDIVRFKYCCTPYRIDGFKILDGAMLYQIGEVWADESDLEPYTEPEENSNASKSVRLSESKKESYIVVDCDKCTEQGKYDKLIRRSQSPNRLQIAAMAMQGILSNDKLLHTVIEAEEEISSEEPISFRAVAKASFAFSDALIAECNGENR